MVRFGHDSRNREGLDAGVFHVEIVENGGDLQEIQEFYC